MAHISDSLALARRESINLSANSITSCCIAVFQSAGRDSLHNLSAKFIISVSVECLSLTQYMAAS